MYETNSKFLLGFPATYDKARFEYLDGTIFLITFFSKKMICFPPKPKKISISLSESPRNDV